MGVRGHSVRRVGRRVDRVLPHVPARVIHAAHPEAGGGRQRPLGAHEQHDAEQDARDHTGARALLRLLHLQSRRAADRARGHPARDDPRARQLRGQAAAPARRHAPLLLLSGLHTVLRAYSYLPLSLIRFSF